MAVNLRGVFNSPQFTFLVGKSEVEFFVHQQAIKAQSPALAAMMSNGMQESINKCAKLPHETEDCFNRFCEFAYTGDYSVSIPEALQGEEHEGDPKCSAWWNNVSRKMEDRHGQSAVSPVASESDFDWPQQANVVVQEQPESLVERWKAASRRYIHWDPSDQKTYIRPPVAIRVYEATFLDHAELYLFSDKYQIPILGDKILIKLAQDLSKAYGDGARLTDYIALIRYIYDEVNGPNERLESLRSLVVPYICSRAHLILNDQHFLELLRDGGNFVADFWSQLTVLETDSRLTLSSGKINLLDLY